ncbi:allantoicase [Persicimonas caeni]|uniref:Probable allantoicase n=1 Tax=Persicimonas caeni TaxID=2292766 RepID=A0A4Y6PTI7_PERCE|nr:allantoicase [Persicimonas caeni]QDG51631.1 allantoicase [Persicimonas caeni]QED32852.1 allantoicase [Persicimonas caeni]
MPFTKYIDLASERLGGAVLIASDEFFAPKENLLKPAEAVWKEGVYTDRGKWMDGWESRRKRTPGHDWCIVRLGLPGLIRGVVVDTAFFRGNYPEACSIEACAVEGQPEPEELASGDIEWVEILPQSDLEGDSKNHFELDTDRRFTHLRFHIYPDGGVARLRVHGEPLPDLDRWERVGEIDLGAIENGGRVVTASDMFFGDANNLLMPGRGKDMGDGWETKRRRGPGYDWVVLELGAEGTVEHVEVDTNHFKGNYPDRFSLEGCNAEVGEGAFDPDAHDWQVLRDETKLQAHTRHHFALDADEPITHVRFNIYPDGGVSRLRLRGQVSEEGWRARKLEWLNTLPEGAAKEAFITCCGSTRWADTMVEQRPYASIEALQQTADEVWADLGEEDYLEAFSAHPKIGERKAEGDQTEKSKQWSEQEQKGAADASNEMLDALLEKNVAYQERHGFIFIVCASGKSADEMLAMLEERLENDRATEIENAAEEQRKITALRLEKLIGKP